MLKLGLYRHSDGTYYIRFLHSPPFFESQFQLLDYSVTQ